MGRKDVSIAGLFFILRKKWWIILLCALIMAAVVGSISIKYYTPVYKSNVLFYVKTQKSTGETSSKDDVNSVNWALKIINSYSTLIHTNSFSDEIINEYLREFPNDDTIKNYNTAKIKANVSVSTVDDTNLFKVSVDAPTAEFAYNVAKCIENITGKFISDKTGIADAVTVADPGIKPLHPNNSNHMKRNTALGFAVGAILVYLILLTIELFDTRVKSEEDLLNSYTLPILGTVPTFEAPSSRKKVYKYGD